MFQINTNVNVGHGHKVKTHSEEYNMSMTISVPDLVLAAFTTVKKCTLLAHLSSKGKLLVYPCSVAVHSVQTSLKLLG